MRLAAVALVLLACSESSTSTPASADAGAPLGPALHAVGGQSDAIYLGVWGQSDDAVWLVGGDPERGRVLRFDGSALNDVPPPAGPTLWWVWGRDDTVWVVGEGGRILRHDGAWHTEYAGGEVEVLWGVWGSERWGLWAVGGSLRAGGPKGIILRSSGDGQWTRLEGAPQVNLYKVWGDDQAVHIVGEGGVALRWDGQLRRVTTETEALLFTVHGQVEGPALAVGGLSGGVAQVLDGNRWVSDPGAPEGLPPLNGVFVRPDGSALVSAARGRLFERATAGSWTERELPQRAAIDTLHAVLHIDDATWVVGGDFLGTEGGRVLTTQQGLEFPAAPELDAGLDSAVPDAAVPDAALPDAAVPDAALPDLAVPDAAVVDAAAPDAAVVDATFDVAVTDSAPDAGPICGDGVLAGDEECDDGNLAGGDGCDNGCRLECGNGRLDPFEFCDDGNRVRGDGCDPLCQLECGNGRLDGDEECDDGQTINGDGCDADCRLECGNGRIEGDETCDDGNRDGGDGCDAGCRLECGNGEVDGGESCDDGNRDPNDGCDPDCQLEVLPGPGERCTEPSFACSEGLECFGIAQLRFREYCVGACASVDDCGPEWGPDPCCTQPGPQLLRRYCIPAELQPDGCP